MKRHLLTGVVSLVLVAATPTVALAGGSGAGGPEGPRMTDRNQRARAFFPKPDAAAVASQTTPLAPLGGSIQSYTKTYAIFWLPPGYTYESGGSSSRYESLLLRYLTDIGGSSLYGTMSQYYDSLSFVGNSSSLSGSALDTSPYPTYYGSAATTDGDIQNEVVKEIKAQGWPYGLHEQFFVFTASGVLTWAQIAGGWSNSGGTSSGYCAYHSAVSGSTFGLGNYSIVYANMPDQDGHYACYAHSGSSYYSPNGDYIADGMISTTSHEQFEMVTDPLLNGWKDSAGFEIGDKCAYVYGTPASDGGDVTLNGHRYILQAEFSNATLKRYGTTGCTLG